MDNSSGVSGAGAVNHSQEPQNTPVEIKIGAFRGSKLVALPTDDVDVKIVIENDDPDISFQIDINDRFVTITTVCNTYIHPSVLPESPQSTTAQTAPDTQASQDIQTTAMPASSPFIDSGDEVKAQENIEKDSYQARAGINDSQPETVSTAEVRETITTANPDNNPTLTTPSGHTVEPMSTGESSIEEPHLTGINTPEKPASPEVLADSITLDNRTDVMDTNPTSRPTNSGQAERSHEPTETTDAADTNGVQDASTQTDFDTIDTGSHNPAPDLSSHTSSPPEPVDNSSSLTSPTTSPASSTLDDQTGVMDTSQTGSPTGAGVMDEDSGSTDITMGSTAPAPLSESSAIPLNVTAGSTTKNREAIVSADSAVAPQAGAEKQSTQAVEVPNEEPTKADAVLVDAFKGASKSEISDIDKAKDNTQPASMSSNKSKRSKRPSDKPQETEQPAIKKKSKSKRKRADNTQNISDNQQPIKNDTPNKSESEKTGKRRKAEPTSGQKETRRRSKEKRSEKGKEQSSPETALKAEPVVIDVSDVTFETPTPDKDTAKSSTTDSTQPPTSSSKTSKRSKNSPEKSEQAEPLSGQKEPGRKSKERRSDKSKDKSKNQPTSEASRQEKSSKVSQRTNEWRMTAPVIDEDGIKRKEQTSDGPQAQNQSKHPTQKDVPKEQQSSLTSQRSDKRKHSESEADTGEAKRIRSDSTQSPKEPSPGSNASDAQRITEQPQRLSEYGPGELDAEAYGIRWVTKESKKVAGEVAIKHGSLGQCIELLTNQAFTQDSSVDSRSSLDLLFDSFEGQSLFTTGDHWQSPAISRRNQALIDDVSVAGNTATFKYNHDDLENKFDAVKAGANDTPVDKKSTLQFIDLFATAIEQERKPTGQETQAQIDKKQERLQALEEIREFVTQLDPDAPDAAALCRLALQLCGRCRERSMVRQQTRPLCGGFATLQAAWGKSPLNMTRLTIRLACDYQAKSDKLAMAYFELPEGIDFSKYDEALADTLLLSTFYDLDRSGSNSKKDMHFSLMLDVAVQSTDKQNPSDSKFIEALEEATRNKAAVKLSLDAKLASFLEENWTNSKSRKLEKDQSWNIDKDFKSFEGSGHIGHAVIMDSCRTLSNGNIEIKIHSWGMGMRLQMKPETLLSHLSINSTIIHHSSAEKLKEDVFFKSPDQQYTYTNEENGLIVFNTNSGMTTKCDDYADEWHLKFDQKLAYLNNTGDIVVVDTHNGNQIVLDDFGGQWHEEFDSTLIYPSKTGEVVVFDMNSGVKTIHRPSDQ